MESRSYLLGGVARHCDIPSLHQIMYRRLREAEMSPDKLLDSFCTDPNELQNRQTVTRILSNHNPLREDFYAFIVLLTDWREYLSERSQADFLDGLTAYTRMETALKLLVRLSDSLQQIQSPPPYLAGLRDFLLDLFRQLPILQLYARWPDLVAEEEILESVVFGFNLDETYSISTAKLLSSRKQPFLKKNIEKAVYYPIKKDDLINSAFNAVQNMGSINSLVEHRNVGQAVRLYGTHTNEMDMINQFEHDFGDNKGGGSPSYLATLSALSSITHSCTSDSAKLVRQYIDTLYKKLSPLRAQIEFYLGGVALIEYLGEKGMPWCFPTLTEDKTFSAKGLYNPYLLEARRLSDQIVSNDVEMARGGEIDIITGANQGGKTTFLTSVALAQLMAQLGLPIAAESATVGIAEDIILVYASEEENLHVSGRLGQEINQLALALKQVREHEGNVFFAFNEPLTGTSSADATLILTDVAAALKLSGARGMLVTHLFGVADAVDRLNELPGSTCENLVAEVEQTSEGTNPLYRIQPGRPQHTSYAYDAVRRAGFSQIQLTGQF